MVLKKRKNSPLMKRSLIAHENPMSPVSEQYRTIRTNLDFASVDSELQMMTVTSAGPSEGKSLTTANLAVVFAQQGKKVLLVDADMRKPTVHYTFRLDNVAGLSNYIAGHDHSLADLINSSRVENLDIMTSGPIAPNPSELLGSQKMDEFLKEVKQKYDLIIFDSPPVLAVTDSQVLTSQTNGTLLVVRNKRTEKEAAKRAKELLEQAKANVLGMVLNDVPQKESGYYVYYGTGK
ncbi:capsular polysaccharide biosynthesis protein, putative tyrosine-protein kinase [Salimicrobium jeotgali]|uniref:non-specific protein-tyrosine kinase n=2 Tax=Salimicrobium jeotgali TaxID=1230341 RepID=K2GLJ5_9BACI|nr:capsular polysaccharide biosynthesis protein, putative tyrosine-protein kinase [Salimicrobium jeotgali]MBM7697061.1 capsular exopolysaccharide synthesis family protein [Salimicrobium jeotgali]